MKYIPILLFLSVQMIGFAQNQDIIHTVYGGQISCKIISMDDDSVQYTVITEESADTLLISQTEIDEIIESEILLPVEKLQIGAGYGLEYGAIGLNTAYFPMENIGIFGGMGMSESHFRCNAGVKYRLIPRFTQFAYPFVHAMYGHNASVSATGEPSYYKAFYGVSAGAGIDVYFGKYKRGIISIACNVPIKSAEVDKYEKEARRENASASEQITSICQVSLGLKYAFRPKE